MSTSHTPKEWTYFKEAPAAYTAMVAMGKAVEDSGLEKDLLELMKLRVSQLNSCAFCLQYHLTISRQLGVPQIKLDLVAGWREAGVFSPRECAAFAWAEKLSLHLADGVTEADEAAVREHFSESELLYLTTAVANINAWNRINIGLRYSPSIPA